jgi:hypothetical protein
MYCVGIGQPETLRMADLVIPGFQKFTVQDLKEAIENRTGLIRNNLKMN